MNASLADYLMEHGILKNADAQKMEKEIKHMSGLHDQCLQTIQQLRERAELWATRCSAYVDAEQKYGTHAELREQVEKSDEDLTTLNSQYDTLIVERAQLRERVQRAEDEIEWHHRARETCTKCNCNWSPSLIESGVCIFCIQKATRERAEKLDEDLTNLNSQYDDLMLERMRMKARADQLREVAEYVVCNCGGYARVLAKQALEETK